MRTTLIAPEPVTPTDVMTVLVCHDGKEAERHAAELLRRLLQRCGEGVEFEVRAWGCQELDWDNIPARAQAHADAMAATFCLVAWSGPGRPAPGLRRLVEEWAQGRRAKPAVMAILHAGDGPNRHLLEELRRAAEHAGVDILPSGESDTAFLEARHAPSGPAPASRIPIDWESTDPSFTPRSRNTPSPTKP